jgi:hypothetical protein
VSATTKASPNPISITTAPVTTGGNTRWMIRGPRTWMRMPHSASTTPATRIAPVTHASDWTVSTPARIAKTPPTNEALVPR